MDNDETLNLPFDVPANEPVTPRAPEQLRRNTDPSTSHASAEAIAPAVGRLQRDIYDILEAHFETEPFTHEQAIVVVRAQMVRPEAPGRQIAESTVRTRIKELVVAGWVKDSGLHVKLASGRQAIRWVIHPGMNTQPSTE